MSDTSAIRNALNGHIDKQNQGDSATLRTALNDTYYNALDQIYNLPYPDVPAPTSNAPTTPSQTTPAAQKPVNPTITYAPQAQTPAQPTSATGNWFGDLVQGVTDNITQGQQSTAGWDLPPPLEQGVGTLFGLGQSALEGVQAVGGGINNLPVVGDWLEKAGQDVGGAVNWWGEEVNTPAAGIGADFVKLTDPMSFSTRVGGAIADQFTDQQPGVNIADIFKAATSPTTGFEPLRDLTPTSQTTDLAAQTWTALQKGDGVGAIKSALQMVGQYGEDEFNQLDPAQQLVASFAFDPLNFIPGLGFGARTQKGMLALSTKGVDRIADAADLLPNGVFDKIKTPVAKVTEVVKSGLQNVMLRATFTDNADDLFNTVDAFITAGKDAKGLDAIVKVMAGMKTIPAQRAQRYIQGFAPVLDEIRNGYRALEKGIDLAGDTSKLPKTFARFAEDVKAGRAKAEDLLEVTQAELATRLQSHMAGEAAKLYPLKVRGAPVNVASRMLNELKGLEALAYIGLSPITFVRNWVNGYTTMAIEGVNPLFNAAGEIARLKKLGQIDRATHLQRAVKMQETMTHTGGVVRQALGQGQYATGMTGPLGTFMSKMAANKMNPLYWYERIEAGMRAKVWTNTYYKAVSHNWDTGKWIPNLDAATEAVLHQYRVDPKEIYNIVREAGQDKGKIVRNLSDYLDGNRGAAIDWDSVAQEMGLGKQDLLNLMDEHDEAQAVAMFQEIAQRVAGGEDKAAVVNEVVARSASQYAEATAERIGATDALTEIRNGMPVRAQGVSEQQLRDRLAELAKQEEELGQELVSLYGGKTKLKKERRKEISRLLDEIDMERPQIQEALGMTDMEILFGTNPAFPTPPKGAKVTIPEVKRLSEEDIARQTAEAQAARSVETAPAPNTVPPTPYAPTVDAIKQRAATLTQPTYTADTVRQFNALFHEGEANAEFAQRALARMSPERLQQEGASIIQRARERGQTWVNTMADMYEDRAHYVLDQIAKGNPKYNTPEYLDRLANGNALTKALRGTDEGFNWTRFDNPYEYRPYEDFAQYRRRTTDAAIERDFIGGTGDTGVSPARAGEGSIPAGSVETGTVGGVNDVAQAVPPSAATDEIAKLRQLAQEDEAATRILSRDEMVKAKARTQADVYEALLNLWNREDVRRVRLGTDAKNRVMAWARRDVLNAADDSRMAATVAADWMDNAVMISRDGETVFDAALSVVAPFQFWRSRYAIQSLRRVADKPARLAWYLKLRDMQDQVQNDPRYPKRLRGRMFMPIQGIPQWAGGGMWFDPLEQLTSIKAVFGQNQFEDGVTDQDVAASIRALAQRGQISLSEASNAIANGKGALWDATKMQLENLTKESAGGDAFTDLFRPHLPLDIIWKLKTGNAADLGVLFPMTRLIRGATSMLPKGSALNPTGQGYNIEGGLKAGLRAITGNQDIPDWDMWEQYRTDRALADMVGDGLITERDAMLALIERRGTFYEQAQARAQEQMRLQNYSVFGGQIFPEGEKAYYKASVLRNQIIDQTVAQLGGNPADMSYGEKMDIIKANGMNKRGTPLGDFYQQHPEWNARQDVFAEPEQRMKGFLTDEMWTRYNSLSALDKKRAKLDNKEFGAFVNNPERDYDNLTVEQVAAFVKYVRGYLPESKLTPQIGAIPQAQISDPQQSYRYQAMLDEQNRLFNLDAMQPKLDTYQTLSANDKRAYRAVNKDVDAYFKWYAAQMRANPDLDALIHPDREPFAPYPVNTQGATNSVIRQATSNLDYMARKIGDTYPRRFHAKGGRQGGAPSVPLSLKLLSPRAQAALKKKWADPSYFLDKDSYGELYGLYRKYRNGSQSFSQWLMWWQQQGGM